MKFKDNFQVELKINQTTKKRKRISLQKTNVQIKHY